MSHVTQMTKSQIVPMNGNGSNRAAGALSLFLMKMVRHVTHIDGSCVAFERVMSHIWMGHVLHVNETCLAYERVMSHVRKSNVSYMNPLFFNFFTTACLVAHNNQSCGGGRGLSHGTNVNGSCH